MKRAKTGGRRSQALDFVMFKVGILRRLMERYSSATGPTQHQTSVAEWRVLTHLFSCDPTTVTDLRTLLCADKAEVSRACSSLIAKGHIVQRPDPSDARRTLLVITPSGIALHDRILPLRRILEDELEATLTAQESRMLHRSLDKLIGHLSAGVAAAGALQKANGGAGLLPSKERDRVQAGRESSTPRPRARQR